MQINGFLIMHNFLLITTFHARRCYLHQKLYDDALILTTITAAAAVKPFDVMKALILGDIHVLIFCSHLTVTHMRSVSL